MLKNQGAVAALERNDIVNAATNALDGLRLIRFVWKFIWNSISVSQLSCVLIVLNLPAKTWIIWNKVPPQKFFSGAMDSAINKATSAFAKIGGDQVILAHIIVLTLKIWWSCQTYHRKLLYYHHHHNQQVRNFVLRKINLQWYLQPGTGQDQQGDATLDEGKVIFLLCQGLGISI